MSLLLSALRQPTAGCLFLSMMLFSGCATTPPQPPAPRSMHERHLAGIVTIHDFSLEGRISAATGQRGFTGTVHWERQNGVDDMRFYSPLGHQLGAIHADAASVTLTTSEQKTYVDTHAAALTERLLGWRMPENLSDWVLGRPGPGNVEILAWDEAGRILHMRQQDWDIHYPAYLDAEGWTLPARVVLKSPKLDLKFAIRHWAHIGVTP